jgi:hypothetical protein
VDSGRGADGLCLSTDSLRCGEADVASAKVGGAKWRGAIQLVGQEAESARKRLDTRFKPSLATGLSSNPHHREGLAVKTHCRVMGNLCREPDSFPRPPWEQVGSDS